MLRSIDRHVQPPLTNFPIFRELPSACLSPTADRWISFLKNAGCSAYVGVKGWRISVSWVEKSIEMQSYGD